MRAADDAVVSDSHVSQDDRIYPDEHVVSDYDSTRSVIAGTHLFGCSVVGQDDTSIGNVAVVTDSNFSAVTVDFGTQADHRVPADLHAVHTQICLHPPAEKIGDIEQD